MDSSQSAGNEIPFPTFVLPSTNRCSTGSDTTSSKQRNKRPATKESTLLRDVIFVEDVQSIPVGRRILKDNGQIFNNIETKAECRVQDYSLLKEDNLPDMPVELTSITGTDLNDDCLMEIFKFMDLTDLCSFAETCDRFQQLVRHFIPKELKVDDVYNDILCTFQPVRSTRLGQYKTSEDGDIERIFENFGSVFSALEIVTCNDFLSDLIAQHCVGNLKILKIDGNPHLTRKLKPVLKQLQVLVLDVDYGYVTIEDKTVLADLDELIELRYPLGQHDDDFVTNNTFVKLEKFVFSHTFNYAYAESKAKRLSSFIRRHKFLKAIDLEIKFISPNGLNIILQAIAESCIELKELGLFFRPLALEHLQQLRSLNSVSILKLEGTSFENGVDWINDLKELRQLRLRFCHLPNDLNEFGFMAQLTNLELVFENS